LEELNCGIIVMRLVLALSIQYDIVDVVAKNKYPTITWVTP
jgi:hypothetical protein